MKLHLYNHPAHYLGDGERTALVLFDLQELRWVPVDTLAIEGSRVSIAVSDRLPRTFPRDFDPRNKQFQSAMADALSQSAATFGLHHPLSVEEGLTNGPLRTGFDLPAIHEARERFRALLSSTPEQLFADVPHLPLSLTPRVLVWRGPDYLVAVSTAQNEAQLHLERELEPGQPLVRGVFEWEAVDAP
jgi:hypothetical protein